jgi:hypothetical protein
MRSPRAKLESIPIPAPHDPRRQAQPAPGGEVDIEFARAQQGNDADGNEQLREIGEIVRRPGNWSTAKRIPA